MKIGSRHKKTLIIIVLTTITGLIGIYLLLFQTQTVTFGTIKPQPESTLSNANSAFSQLNQSNGIADSRYPTITPPANVPATPLPDWSEQTQTITLDSQEITEPKTGMVSETSTPTQQLGQQRFDEQPSGYSVEGREIETYQFGGGPDHRLIVAGIHGGYEWNTTKLAEEMIFYLQQNPQMIPDEITLFIIPSLNPDGLARSTGYEGRANANGVDLNRNWDAYWKAEWDPTGCWNYLPITGGSQPFSEPETQFLSHFILQNQIRAIISYHSAALGIFAGDFPNHAPSIHLAESLAPVTDYPYPPIESGCEFTGQFADWAAMNNVAAIDIELTNHRDTDLTVNLQVLKTFLNWTEEH